MAACVSGCGVCTGCCAACNTAQHPVHTFTYFSQAQCKLPEDGLNGPKHEGVDIRYFNVNLNILYV